MIANATYRFRIVNLTKKSSLYSNGEFLSRATTTVAIVQLQAVRSLPFRQHVERLCLLAQVCRSCSSPEPMPNKDKVIGVVLAITSPIQNANSAHRILSWIVPYPTMNLTSNWYAQTTFIRSHSLSSACVDQEFAHAGDTCYIAHCYPYTFTDLKDDLDHLSMTRPCEIFRRDVLCESLAGNACFIITVTDECK